jgi:sugar lactone lactonase YvrE
VDAAGNYWCAMYEGGRIVQLSPAGQLLREIEVPVRCPTMPCFGGPEGKTLFVTSASHGRPPDELAALPDSGRVLSLEAGVAGLPVNFFID